MEYFLGHSYENKIKFQKVIITCLLAKTDCQFSQQKIKTNFISGYNFQHWFKRCRFFIIHTFLLTGEEQRAFLLLQGVHSCKQGGEECCHPDLVTPLCLTGSESAHQPHYTGERRIAFRKSMVMRMHSVIAHFMCPSSAAICIGVLPLLFTRYFSWLAESPSSSSLIAARLPYFAAMCNGVLPAPSVARRSLEPHVGSLSIDYSICKRKTIV